MNKAKRDMVSERGSDLSNYREAELLKSDIIKNHNKVA